VNITYHFPILVVALPLVGGALTPFVGKINKRYCALWSILITFFSLIISLFLVLKLALTKKPINYYLGGWSPPYGIEIRFDELSAASAVILGLILLALIFSWRYVQKELDERSVVPYYSLFLLNTAGMVGFVVTGDIFNLFVFLEILSLSAYALVAIGGERIAEMAAFKYLLMGAISSLAILLGIAFLYSITGTLNMYDLHQRLQHTPYLKTASLAFSLFLIGFCVKAAIFPLHIWLPDAHAIAPCPVSALLSGLVVKSGILGILRIISIYGLHSVLNLTFLNSFLAWLGTISIVLGAFFAFFQNDIKMMLAYSTISNIGYIVLGIGLADYYGLVGGIVHIFNHAIIKVTLFLCSGALIYRTGLRTLSDLRGIGRKMPVTMACMSIAIIAITGIPPTNGFICKWFIAIGAVQGDKPLFAAALLFGALFIFAYYIKILNSAYFREPVRKEVEEATEAPLSLLIPILLLTSACLVFGILAYAPLTFIKPFVERLLA
jgi:multicomponent Na+:H+ antiporter subunit D